MAKLYFRYGTMNSGKSAQLIQVAHNYEEQGKRVIVFSPAIDTRSAENVVESRIGLSHEAISVREETNLLEEITKVIEKYTIACVLVDEAQFLTSNHIAQLALIVDTLSIPVIAYGLRTDFKGDLFEGSKYLLARADEIDEIKTICACCGKKATMNARYINGAISTTGPQIMIGGNDKYKVLCRKHFLEEFCKAKGIKI